MKTILFILMSMVVFSISAAEVKPAKISRIMMDQQYGQKLYVKLTPSPAKIVCNTNSVWDFVLFSGSEVGEDMLSQMLIAYSEKKEIKILSNGKCDVNNIEIATRIELF